MRWDGQVAVEAAGELSFEAADRVASGLAFGDLARDVGLGVGVHPGAGDRDDVQRVVELAVAAFLQPVAGALTCASRRARASVAPLAIVTPNSRRV